MHGVVTGSPVGVLFNSFAGQNLQSFMSGRAIRSFESGSSGVALIVEILSVCLFHDQHPCAALLTRARVLGNFRIGWRIDCHWLFGPRKADCISTVAVVLYHVSDLRGIGGGKR